jgi:hypothetical protein
MTLDAPVDLADLAAAQKSAIHRWREAHWPRRRRRLAALRKRAARFLDRLAEICSQFGFGEN